MQNKSHFPFWFGLALLLFIAGPFLRPPGGMMDFVRAEIRTTHEALGPRVTNYIVKAASTIFEYSPLSTSKDKTTEAARREAQLREVTQSMGSMAKVMKKLKDTYLDGLVLACFVFIIRLCILLAWLIVLLPLLFCAGYDGLMERKVKMAEFGAVRPAAFTVAGMFVFPLLFLPALYLVAPITISPLYLPAWAIVVALPLKALVSNMQPLFGR